MAWREIKQHNWLSEAWAQVNAGRGGHLDMVVRADADLTQAPTFD